MKFLVIFAVLLGIAMAVPAELKRAGGPCGAGCPSGWKCDPDPHVGGYY
ncbi:hypothetical protein Ptr902_10681 [Pyrenophora tritici-repentis]|nr:hypothetical protein Ptr902_10681 [Pyrenophora tritici-repentis]